MWQFAFLMSYSNEKTVFLTPLQILAIHDQVIKKFGGSAGMRDLGLLESAAARPMATFGREDMYQTIFDKAAALFHSLLKNHPFVDGNKRTAYSSAAMLLKLNGYRLENKHKEAIEFTVEVETKNLNIDKISFWLKRNSTRI